MANLLYQQIEMLSREKHIEPEVVVSAIEDAMVVAARKIYNEYHNRVGEMVTVIVKRVEGPDLIVDMGRTEARLPKREQSKLETYNIGERLRVVIKMVDRAAKGPQLIVSRADARLVQRLFEMEVPEIYDGTVQIRFAAREAGERTK